MAKRNDQQKKYTFETFEKTQIKNIFVYHTTVCILEMAHLKPFNPANSLPVDFLCWELVLQQRQSYFPLNSLLSLNDDAFNCVLW